jgi:hypothetical protein
MRKTIKKERKMKTLRIFERISAENYQKRYAFSSSNYTGDQDGHPDQRAIECPAELLIESEWSVDDTDRRGNLLGFGSYYDPGTDEFFGIRYH